MPELCLVGLRNGKKDHLQHLEPWEKQYMKIHLGFRTEVSSTPLPGLANLNCPALVRIPQHGCAGDKVKSGNLSGEAATLGLREDGHLDAAVVHQGAGQLSFLRRDQFTLFEGAHKSCLEVRIDVCNLQEFSIVKERRGASLIPKRTSKKSQKLLTEENFSSKSHLISG